MPQGCVLTTSTVLVLTPMSSMRPHSLPAPANPVILLIPLVVPHPETPVPVLTTSTVLVLTLLCSTLLHNRLVTVSLGIMPTLPVAPHQATPGRATTTSTVPVLTLQCNTPPHSLPVTVNPDTTLTRLVVINPVTPVPVLTTSTAPVLTLLCSMPPLNPLVTVSRVTTLAVLAAMLPETLERVVTLPVLLAITPIVLEMVTLLALVLFVAVAATPLLVMPKLVHALLVGTPALDPPVPVQGTVTTKNVATMLSQATPLLVVVPVVTLVMGLHAQIHLRVPLVPKLLSAVSNGGQFVQVTVIGTKLRLLVHLVVIYQAEPNLNSFLSITVALFQVMILKILMYATKILVLIGADIRKKSLKVIVILL